MSSSSPFENKVSSLSVICMYILIITQKRIGKKKEDKDCRVIVSVIHLSSSSFIDTSTPVSVTDAGSSSQIFGFAVELLPAAVWSQDRSFSRVSC